MFNEYGQYGFDEDGDNNKNENGWYSSSQS